MSPALETETIPVIIGRSSSHFTRITRIFAAELHVDYTLKVVPSLTSTDPGDYGGNPALRVPALQTSTGVWFGALNICRELARQSGFEARIVWPENLESPVLSNAQELVLQAMATEVSLIMTKVSGNEGGSHRDKMRRSLVNMVAWLDDNVRGALNALPSDRQLSYLEVSLFCFVTHLLFRDVLPLRPFANLNEFCAEFARRPSAEATVYRFDA